jgi:adenylosuccinate synthase
VNENSNFA